MSAVIDVANINAEWEQEPQHDQRLPEAADFVADRQSIVRHAQAAMESARQSMAHQEGSKRKLLTLIVGDQVSLKSKHLVHHVINTLPSE